MPNNIDDITIKTDEDYKAALFRIDEIMDVEEPNSDEDYLYDKLVIAIQQYEYDHSRIIELEKKVISAWDDQETLKDENAALKKKTEELEDIIKMLETPFEECSIDYKKVAELYRKLKEQPNAK